MRTLQDKPGMNDGIFYLKLEDKFFKKGELFNSVYGSAIVTKVYKRTWWRRLLTYLGIKTKIFNLRLLQPNEVKCRSLEDD